MLSFPIVFFISVLCITAVYLSYKIFNILIERYKDNEDKALLGP